MKIKKLGKLTFIPVKRSELPEKLNNCCDDNGRSVVHWEERLTLTELKAFLFLEREVHFSYEPEGTKKPPDFLVRFGDEKIILEVRRTGDGYLLLPENSGALVESERQGIGLLNMLKTIEDLTKKENFLKQDETLVLIFKNHVPYEGRAKLAKKIVKEIRGAYVRNKIAIKCHDNDLNFCINIDKLSIELFATKYYYGKPTYSVVKYILAAPLESSNLIAQVSLTDQAIMILRNIVEEKIKKLAHLDGKKWLAIFNTHPLLDIDIFRDAFSKIGAEVEFAKKIDVFEKIFLLHFV